jgi:hypothetical protein
MNELSQQATDISYTLVGDYFLPDLLLPPDSSYTIGRYGREHLNYIKHNHRIEYMNLLTSGSLNVYLHEIDITANERMEGFKANGAARRCDRETQGGEPITVGSENVKHMKPG